MIAGHSVLFEKGMIKGMRILSAMIGILLIIFGLYLRHGAVFRAKVDDGIINNKPAFMLFCADTLFNDYAI